MNTEQGATSFQLSSSKSDNDYVKYGGMIKPSQLKVFKKNLNQLINYVYTVSPRYQAIHYIITFFRIVQFFFPSLIPTNPKYDKNLVLKNTVSVFSVLCYILPSSLRGEASVYFLIAYELLCIFFIGTIVGCAYYFRKSAQLPTFVSQAIVIFLATGNFVLHPIALNFSFEIWSNLIFNNNVTINYSATIVVPIITLIIYFSYDWIFSKIITHTLYFRPMSFQTVTTRPQHLMFVTTNLINVIFGLASHAPLIGQTVLYIINAIIYFASVIIPYVHGGMINKRISACYIGAALTGGTMSAILAIFMAVDIDLSMAILIVFFALFFVFTAIARCTLIRSFNKRIMLCDVFSENKDIRIFKNRNELINSAIDGMLVAHPATISGEMFKESVDLWPNDTLLWFVYAKFTSIYPEQNITLEWIFQRITALKIKGADAHTIKEQSLLIARQREMNLNNALKVRLNTMSKSMMSTKAKLRHVWDVIIQGSIGEMEGSIKKFYKDVEHNEADFKHLFRTYPNNRFVTRNYARFCRELDADMVGYNEYTDMSKQMQRGIMVNEDQANILGIHAFKNLPARTTKLRDPSMSADINDLNASESGALFDTNEDYGYDQDLTQVITIRDTIDTLKVPSIRKTRIMRVGMILILYIALVIVVMIYLPIYMQDIIDILQYMNFMGGCRNNNYQISITTFHYIYEKLGVYNPTIDQPMHPPKCLGSSYDTLTQINYLIGKAVFNFIKLQQFNSYKTKNKFIITAQKLFFEKAVNYTYFTDQDDSVSHELTILTAFMDIADQAHTAIDKVIVPSDVNTSIVLNLMHNVEIIGDIFNRAFQSIVDGIIDDYDEMKKIALLVLIIGAIFYAIIFIVALVIQLRWINDDKMEVYRALINLPKNQISLLAENLRNLKTDGNGESTSTESELNKQEDNIMKIFLNGGYTGYTKLSDGIMLIIGSICMIIIAIVSLYIVTHVLKYWKERMMVSAPHLDWEIATFNQFQYAQFLLQILTMLDTNNPYRPVIYTKEYVEKSYSEAVVKGRDYYHKDRFGAANGQGRPFTGYQEGLDKADELLNCTDKAHVPTGFFDMLYCFNAEGIFILFDSILSRVITKRDNQTGTVNPKDTYIDYLYTLLMYPIYDGFICNMFGTIIPAIKEELKDKWDSQSPLLLLLLALSILFELGALVQLKFIDKHIKQSLHLLLHLSITVITSNSRVMKVLNGNFKNLKTDFGRRNAEFFDQVFECLPDGVVIVDPSTRVIETSNQAVERFFNKSKTELKDQPIEDLMRSIGASEFRFGKNSKIIKINDMDIEFSSAMIIGKLVLSMRDRTSITRYNNLIRDERKKSDALLTTILPPVLIERVIGGEKNISFAVQSATILFMDIVSFTPWCGALPADKVMMTLNLLFKYFDEALNKYAVITKVKCIGDCYMCAGGIFSEINQPSEHARDVVSFGLDSLDCLERLNKELDETLRIRVGINEGGPIVAGVLGIGKPTFEIIGPAINMAQQMEHHGVPQAVHISRSVYELVYGDMFNIKERGTIEVKNGKMVTYLVSRKK